MKLFLKGDRCFTEKCAIEKRNYAPGQHGKGGRIKSKLQGYGLRAEVPQRFVGRLIAWRHRSDRGWPSGSRGNSLGCPVNRIQGRAIAVLIQIKSARCTAPRAVYSAATSASNQALATPTTPSTD